MSTKTITFNNPANFTTVNTEVTTVGTLAKLPLQSGEALVANYRATIDAIRGVGTLTGSASGGASIGGGGLDLLGGGIQFVDYNADNITAATSQKGAFRTRITPGYNGSPASSRAIMEISNNTNNNNRILIDHRATGDIGFAVFSNVGGAFFTLLIPWVASSSVETEIEINWDLTAGLTEFYMDGVLKGSNLATGTRDATGLATLRIGGGLTGTVATDYAFNDFSLFDTVQHTANYTAPIIPSEFESEGKITPIDITALDALESLSEVVLRPTNTDVKYHFNIGSNSFYIAGGAVVASDGSNAQSNTIAEITSNLALIDAVVDPGVSTFNIVPVLTSTDGIFSPEVTSISYDFNFFAGRLLTNSCIVYGYILDSLVAVSGGIISFKGRSLHKDQGNFIRINAVATSRTNGYFEIELPQTTTPAITIVDVKISFTDSLSSTAKSSFNITVPDQATAELEDIINA